MERDRWRLLFKFDTLVEDARTDEGEQDIKMYRDRCSFCLKPDPLAEDARIDEKEHDIRMDRDRWRLLSKTWSSSRGRENKKKRN